MEPLLVHPDPPPPELARLLDLGGYAWKPVGDERAAVTETPDDGWGGAIVVITEQSDAAWALCRAIRKGDLPVEPLLLLIGGNRLDELDLRDELYDDFCLDPFHPRELEARLRHLFWRSGFGAASRTAWAGSASVAVIKPRPPLGVAAPFVRPPVRLDGAHP